MGHRAFALAALAAALLVASPEGQSRRFAVVGPEVDAQVNEIWRAELPAAVDAVSATEAVATRHGWGAQLNDVGPGGLTNPRIELDRVSPALAFTPPVGPFPMTLAQPSLGPGEGMVQYALAPTGGYR